MDVVWLYTLIGMGRHSNVACFDINAMNYCYLVLQLFANHDKLTKSKNYCHIHH